MVTKTEAGLGTSTIILLIMGIIFGGPLMNEEIIYYGTDGIDITCQPRLCESLSKVNSNGIQTRCYFFSEERNKTTYKSCSTGWLKYEQTKSVSLDSSQAYLLCTKKNDFMSECQELESGKVVYKYD